MTLLFDQNLSPKLVAALASEFPGSVHLRHLLMREAQDDAVWDFARANGHCIVTKDEDFRHRSLVLGHPPKVVWLTLGNCSTGEILALLKKHAADVQTFGANANASLMVISRASAAVVVRPSGGGAP